MTTSAPAADIRANHAHVLRGKREKNHQIAAHGEDPLSGDPHCKLIAILSGYRPVRFE